MAAYYGNLEIARLLLNHENIDINSANLVLKKILFLNDVFIFKINGVLLIKYFNFSALHLAANRGHIEITDLLIRQENIDYLSCTVFLLNFFFIMFQINF
mgnify:CR=1 FL=1